MLWQDVQYGWRVLRRSPGFAIIAVLTLAIGIGANAAIFSVIHAVLLRPLPFPESNRVVWVWETDKNRNVRNGTASLAEFLDWRDQNHVFEELSAWRMLFFTITGNGEPEQDWGSQVTGNFFRMLRVKPMLGRDFLAEEEQPGHEQVVILSYAIWQRRYGGDRGIINRNITIDYKPYTVIGVLPPGFNLFGTTRKLDFWVPFALNRAQLDRENHELVVFARLQPGVGIAKAQAEMETILARLKQEYPGVDPKTGVRVVGFHDDLVSKVRPALLILFAAVAFVLLISCANVANLLLAHAAAREREIAIRATLGAGGRRILRQLLTESLLLALFGGAFGVLIAYGGLLLLRAVLPVTGGSGELPHSEGIGVNGIVLCFTLGISLLTGVVFGIVPAIQLSRSKLYESLKEGSRGTIGGRRSHFARSALVVSEVALSLMLLAGAGLLIRSFVLLVTENLGFDPSNVLTMELWLPEVHVSSSQQVVRFYQQIIDRLNALSGVKSASAINFPPLSGWNGFCDFDIRGRATPPPDEQFTSQYRVVDWRYMRTMRITLKEGRDFAVSDGPDAAGVAIVNEALARRYWPQQDPVGQQIRLDFPATRNLWEPVPKASWLTIVGVASDIHDWYWGEAKIGQLYLPDIQNPSRIMHLVVRTEGDPMALVSAARQAVETVGPDQPVTEIRTMDDLVAASLAQRRLSMVLLGIFAAVATALAALGIYGVMAYGVGQRTHEIGIRMALGAHSGDILRMIVRDGMRLAAIGLVLGIMASFVTMRYLENQLYGVKAIDPVTLISVAIFLGTVAAAACYFPARRAAKVDPLVALRYE
jgi:putative ABC transport system permease protein